MTSSKQPVFPFSDSPLWALQRAYYENQGVEAWRNDQVPQFITSNPMIAAAYAEILFAFLQDRAIMGHGAEPVTMLELGAGSGLLAFHVLDELRQLIELAGMRLPPFRYVMSDLAERNISHWREHPKLIPYVERGWLDFATFDAVSDTELFLVESGHRITPGDLKQPLLIVANYFFDSIPQDLLYVGEGQIYACDVSLILPEGTQEATPEMMERIIPEYHYRKSPEYEQDSYAYSEIIALYKRELEDSHILFPSVGLSCLERLGRLSQEGFVLLTADKGVHRLDHWAFAPPPDFVHHGSFSLTANYHAIQHTLESRGALALFTPHHYRNLNVGCILMLEDPSAYGSTRLAYRRSIESFGPDDFFNMKLWFDDQLNTLDLSQILTFWRLGRYDAEWFSQCAYRLSVLVLTASEEESKDVVYGIQQMWQGFYQVAKHSNLALRSGMLLYQMERYEEAMTFFNQAEAEETTEPEVGYAVAISSYELGDEERAKKFVLRTLSLDAEHEGALSLLLLLN
ncbi:hypothetical protein SY83_21310 [Paenibacillus swuensis]|uniref:Uncharacterized protein n=1 Tax=Paenibacillus swuensis TaxID=1178515 RepID=A0A172TN45_9BACL|nr:hypothetical protein [Paenibacillus swuensis]ANE48396.1 hypothetical protein SY83_21310 [Paenibacillus swuensis]